MRRLPPLNALKIFEVAARTSSYAQAGAELGLTHGAVSRQIAILEDWLGQRLFVRTGQRMRATPAARVFAAEVSLSFDRLVAAAEACGHPAARSVVRLDAPTTFAMRWLIPRLERFHTNHPDVEVVVTTSTTMRDELRGGFDVAVRRGSAERNAWPQYQATPFLSEVDTLIASPALLDRIPLRAPSDVAAHVLLGSETRPGDWADWLERAGVPHRAGQRHRTFDHFFVTLQAVTDGLGLGIGPFPVLEGDKALGRIATPFPDVTVPRTGYVALVPLDGHKSSSMARLLAWLIAEGGSVNA